MLSVYLIGYCEAPAKHHMELRGRDQWVEKWTQRTATSDEEGLFSLAGVKTGTLPVAVRATGFGFWRTEVELTEGERAWLDITLGEVVTVTGTVTDEWGEPLADATVRAYDRMPETPFIQGGQIDFELTFGYVAARSDEQGRYRLTGLTPGEVFLFAQQPRESRMSDTVPFARTVLHAEPGDAIEWNPVISPGRTIDGIVLYADGYPMGNVFVTATDEQSGLRHVLYNDKEGRFRFICLEGATYKLHVQYWRSPPGTPPLEEDGVIPEQGSVELRAPFAKPVEGPRGTIIGRLNDAGRRVPHEGALQVLLVYDNNAWRTDAEIEENVFRWDDIPAGGYRVVAMAGETVIAEGDRFEIAAAEVRDIGVLETEPPGTVVLKLERGEGALDLEPRIYLQREGWIRGSEIAMGRRSEVRLDNLTAGTYRVTGFASGMVGLEGEVEVRIGEESELVLTVSPAAFINFEVWFPEDRATGTATVRIVGTDGTVLREYESTPGRVLARPFDYRLYVPRGEWTIEVTTDTGWSGTSQFKVDDLTREYPVVRVDAK